jgi:predicted O-methyltransferase YrrM
LIKKILILFYNGLIFLLNIKNFIFFNQKKIEDEQNSFFNFLQLNRKKGLERLKKIFQTYAYLKDAMNSEHQVFFSSLSKKKKINSILEIGTYDGKNAFLLSKLFPESLITTVDLPDESKEFNTTYNRNNIENRRKFYERRDLILSSILNLKFLKKNSIQLLNHFEKFDLIWIDGAHGHPVVSVDILNSLRLLNEDGIIACDDILVDKLRKQDSVYHSNAAHELIEALKLSGIIDVTYIYKRTLKKFNVNLKLRKYIAIFKKK